MTDMNKYYTNPEYRRKMLAQNKQYNKKNWEKIKAKQYKWRDANPEKVKEITKRTLQKQRFNRTLDKLSHPELYHVTKTGRFIPNLWKGKPIRTPEQIKAQDRIWNAKWQRTKKGRGAHNRAAREYARRKQAKLVAERQIASNF